VATRARRAIPPDNAKLTDWPIGHRWETLSAAQRAFARRPSGSRATRPTNTDHEIARCDPAGRRHGPYSTHADHLHRGDNGTQPPECTLSVRPLSHLVQRHPRLPIEEQLSSTTPGARRGLSAHGGRLVMRFDTPGQIHQANCVALRRNPARWAISWPNAFTRTSGACHSFHHLIDIWSNYSRTRLPSLSRRADGRWKQAKAHEGVIMVIPSRRAIQCAL